MKNVAKTRTRMVALLLVFCMMFSMTLTACGSEDKSGILSRRKEGAASYRPNTNKKMSEETFVVNSDNLNLQTNENAGVVLSEFVLDPEQEEELTVTRYPEVKDRKGDWALSHTKLRLAT